MAKFIKYKSKALRPIPRVVDNTEAMAIEQSNDDMSHVPLRRSDSPGGRGTFSPKSNVNFK